MSEVPAYLKETNHEEVTKKELFKRVNALVGSCQRTSLGHNNVGVCRVDKGSSCNEVLGFLVFKDNQPTKYYAVVGLTGLEKWKINKGLMMNYRAEDKQTAELDLILSFWIPGFEPKDLLRLSNDAFYEVIDENFSKRNGGVSIEVLDAELSFVTSIEADNDEVYIRVDIKEFEAEFEEVA